MKRLRLKFSVIFGILFILSAFTYPSKIHVLSFEEFEPYLHMNDDYVYVINFWATWCKPCTEELPYFEEMQNKYKDKKVRVLLVSLDFPTQIESHVIPFLDKNSIKAKVILLDDPDANAWIDKVDNRWSGAIPATYVYKNSEHSFHEGKMTKDQLENQIKKYL